MSEASGTRGWLAARAPVWRTLGQFAAKTRRSRNLSVEGAQELLDGYRSLARDLATARRTLGGSVVTNALEGVYGSFHALIDRPPRNSWAAVLRLLRIDAPAVMRSLRAPLLGVTALFVLSACAGWWLIATFPELVGLIASEEMVTKVEHGELWTDGLLNITPSSVLSIRIFSNNIAVSIAAVCFGVFYGLGTFYLIALNGLMLGAVFAFTHQYGMAGALFKFVVAHGTVELSVICIAGAAGLSLGESLARPKLTSRLESFQQRVAELAKLLPLLGALLIVCGLIEGYVSPDPSFPLASRLVIGVCYFLVMLAALSGRLFGARRAA